jgi:hypothetical protein
MKNKSVPFLEPFSSLSPGFSQTNVWLPVRPKRRTTSCIQIIFDCQVGQEIADQEKRNLLDALFGRVLE